MKFFVLVVSLKVQTIVRKFSTFSRNMKFFVLALPQQLLHSLVPTFYKALKFFVLVVSIKVTITVQHFFITYIYLCDVPESKLTCVYLCIMYTNIKSYVMYCINYVFILIRYYLEPGARWNALMNMGGEGGGVKSALPPLDNCFWTFTPPPRKYNLPPLYI